MVDWNTESTEMDSLEFLSLREQMKNDGEAAFAFDRVRMSNNAGSTGEGQVITLINTAASQAAAVWVTPYPDAKFEGAADQTDGARLGRALARCFPGASNDETLAKANEAGGTLTVRKNEFGDSWAWLWEVTKNE